MIPIPGAVTMHLDIESHPGFFNAAEVLEKEDGPVRVMVQRYSYETGKMVVDTVIDVELLRSYHKLYGRFLRKYDNKRNKRSKENLRKITTNS